MMTTPTPSNNSNGNGYTVKEYLARIDAKLDTVAGGLEAVRLDLAVHEAKAFHESARQELTDIRDATKSNTMRLAAIGGGVAAGVFLVELALRFFT